MIGKNRSTRAKGIFLLIAISLVVAIICIGASFVTAKWFADSKLTWRQELPHGHEWLHEALNLTGAEEKAIDAFEAGYRSQRDGLTKEFDSRIGELREILVNKQHYVPEVDIAIHRIHEIHGKLQELSIQHYYNMLSVLPPEKQEKLRQLAVKALSQPE